jgi:hypothetical protein
MPSGIIIALIALLPHADKATQFKLFLTISVMLTQGNAMKRILSGATRKLLRRGIGLFLTVGEKCSVWNKQAQRFSYQVNDR